MKLPIVCYYTKLPTVRHSWYVGTVNAVSVDEVYVILNITLESEHEEFITRAAVFDQMAIEYHSGYARLKRVLESAGFETALKPIRSTRVLTEKQGYIVARRKNR
jgi:hypothetical protein